MDSGRRLRNGQAAFDAFRTEYAAGWVLGERAVGARARAVGIVFENRFPEAGRLAQPNRSRNDGVIDAIGKMFPHFRDHLRAQVCPTIKHRHDDSTELEIIVRSRIAHPFNDADDFYQAFEGEVFRIELGARTIRRRRQRIRHENSNEGE